MGIVAFVYGVVCYAVFLGSFLYAVGFVGNVVVPKSIDSGVAGPVGPALLVNAALLGAFAVQHSGMARQGFKRVWTRIVPPAVERSTYVLVSSLLLVALYVFWRPMPEAVWSVEHAAASAALTGLYWLGWLIVLTSTFMIDHFDLFGLRQVWRQFTGRADTGHRFVTPLFYRVVRHPLYFGFILALWGGPVMTVGHALFAGALTAYILIAIQLEERDLVRQLGERYVSYRQKVPMLVPGLARPFRDEDATAPGAAVEPRA